MLGPPRSSLGEIYTYDTPGNKVNVSYSSDPCKANGASSQGTTADVVLKISISPKKTILVKNLSLDKNKYKRIQNDHPENWVHYLNSADGITVDAILNNGSEEVIGIIYQASAKDRELRCGQTENKNRDFSHHPTLA